MGRRLDGRAFGGWGGAAAAGAAEDDAVHEDQEGEIAQVGVGGTHVAAVLPQSESNGHLLQGGRRRQLSPTDGVGRSVLIATAAAVRRRCTRYKLVESPAEGCAAQPPIRPTAPRPRPPADRRPDQPEQIDTCKRLARPVPHLCKPARPQQRKCAGPPAEGLSAASAPLAPNGRTRRLPLIGRS